MVSDTEKSHRRRTAKKRKAGRDRKKSLEKKGSTPKFPIQPEGAEKKK